MKTFNEKSFEDRLSELREFCSSHNRLPQYKYGGYEGVLRNFLSYYKFDCEVSSIIDTYKKFESKSFEEKLKDLSKFCMENLRLPLDSNSNYEKKLNKFIKMYGSNIRVRSIIERYSKVS